MEPSWLDDQGHLDAEPADADPERDPRADLGLAVPVVVTDAQVASAPIPAVSPPVTLQMRSVMRALFGPPRNELLRIDWSGRESPAIRSRDRRQTIPRDRPAIPTTRPVLPPPCGGHALRGGDLVRKMPRRRGTEGACPEIGVELVRAAVAELT